MVVEDYQLSTMLVLGGFSTLVGLSAVAWGYYEIREAYDEWRENMEIDEDLEIFNRRSLETKAEGDE